MISSSNTICRLTGLGEHFNSVLTILRSSGYPPPFPNLCQTPCSNPPISSRFLLRVATLTLELTSCIRITPELLHKPRLPKLIFLSLMGQPSEELSLNLGLSNSLFNSAMSPVAPPRSLFPTPITSDNPESQMSTTTSLMFSQKV